MIFETNDVQNFLVVFNPVKNSSRKRILANLLKKLTQLQAARGKKHVQWHLYPTAPGLAANLHYFSKHLHEYTDVIVLGGDGTFNLVVNAIMAQHKPDTSASDPVSGSTLAPQKKSLLETVRVGLLPAGTGNDFARKWYGKNCSLASMLEIVTGTHCGSIYLGACEMKTGTRYFHNALGTGFDSVIAKKLVGKKALFKSFSYTLAALRHIPFFNEPEVSLQVKGNQSKTYHNLVTVFANSHYFGGGLPIAPMASAKQPQLEILHAEKLSILAKVMLLIRLVIGTHMGSKDINHISLESPKSATITTPGLDLQADGEYIGTTPCKVFSTSQTILLKRAH